LLARIRKAIDEREGGFTLIELLVVIIIIGILAAIAIPVFLSQRQKGYDAQAKSDLRNFATQEESYFVDKNTYDTYANVTLAANQGTFNHTSQIAVSGFYPSGFCLVANKSTSAKWWLYDSAAGGLQANSYATQAAATAACSQTGAAGWTVDGTLH
jgi:type IV pilus assembly protein PilA